MSAPQDNPGAAPLTAREFVGRAFRKFLHENFAGPAQVARAYTVDQRTAEYWWRGAHVPNGVVVCLSFGMFPDSAARHLRLVVDNPAPEGPQPLRLAVAEDRRRA